MKTITFSKLTIDELILIVGKGQSVKTLMLADSFFFKSIVPELEEELSKIEGALHWAPGTTESTVEKIALDRVWKSGVAIGIGKIWEVINRIKNEGLEAEKEMGLREKKKAL